MQFIHELGFWLITQHHANSSDNLLQVFDPEKDHLVGVCGPRVRVLCGQVSRLEGELKECFNRIPMGEINLNSRQWLEACGNAFIIRKKIEAGQAHITIALHEDIPELLCMNFVGIRRGWKVVRSDREQDLLRGPDPSDIATCLFYKELVMSDKSIQRARQRTLGL